MALDDITRESPITITDTAAEKVRYFAKSAGDTADRYLRIFVQGGGCSGVRYGFAFDKKGDADKIYTDNGIEFILDDWNLPLLEGSTVDYTTDARGSGFTVKSSKAKKMGCCDTGCG
ncbi:TPA: iron-sulfur cluster assembly accessory protein [Candidatus Woesearchaeota archaeon]|nr:iron-sulfur cluster assembly accessory protein [Candidatus Woesearchaeota archaeon]